MTIPTRILGAAAVLFILRALNPLQKSGSKLR